MKRVIMFIFLAFALSSCGDISLDSDGGGNSSNINSGSDSSNGNSGNTSDESGDDSSDGNSGNTSDESGDDSSDGNSGDTSDGSGDDSSDENNGDTSDGSGDDSSDENSGDTNDGNGDDSSDENSGDISDGSGDGSSDENNGDTSDGNGDDGSDGNSGDAIDGNEVVKFDCYTIDNLDVECYAIPLSSAVEINEYNWDFGDSSATYSGKYTAQVVTHRYRRSGEYNIKLDVKYLDSGIQKTLSYSKPVSVKQTSFPFVFANGFGAEVDKMYYALHITGSSQINSATKTGLFAQKGNDGFGDGSYKEDFARDLYYQLSSGGAHLKFSELHKAVGVSDFYSNEYGFTDSDGLVFDMPFYFGMASWNIPVTNSNGKVSFVSFALEDTTRPVWGGYAYPVFVRCNNNMFNFQIPMNEYDAGRHKNVALFTVKFTGVCNYTVEFDGFLDK